MKVTISMASQDYIKIREYVGSYTRYVEPVEVDGFVVKPEHLEKLESTIESCYLFQGQDPSRRTNSIEYRAFLNDGTITQFANLTSLLDYANTPPQVIEGLRLSKLNTGHQKVEIEFNDSGQITIDACGPPHIVEGVVHTLSRQLRATDQRYSGIVKFFLFNRRLRRLLSELMFGAIMLLVYFTIMYIYALSIGVDIDPNLIPEGNTYFQEVEAALKSSELPVKMDTLLKGNLRNFTNVSDYFVRTQAFISASLIALLVLGVTLWLLKHLRQYYPLTFFAIGNQNDELARIEKRRDLWVTGIIIGFIVNIVAGVIVAFFGG